MKQETNTFLKVLPTKRDWDIEIRENLPIITRKKHEIVNIFINIGVASSCIFLFKLPIFLLPIALILLDVMLLPLNIYFIRILPTQMKNCTDTNQLKKRITYLEKRIKKEKDQLSNNHTFFERSIIRNDVEELESELCRVKRKIKKVEEVTDSKVTTAYEQIQIDNKEKIADTINAINNIKLSKLMKEEGIALSDVTDKAKSINKILKEHPAALQQANTTFNLYGAELVNVINNVRKMTDDEQRIYIPKIKTVIEEYSSHLDRLEERIKKDDYLQTNVDLDVLLKEITKDKGDK